MAAEREAKEAEGQTVGPGEVYRTIAEKRDAAFRQAAAEAGVGPTEFARLPPERTRPFLEKATGLGPDHLTDEKITARLGEWAATLKE